MAKRKPPVPTPAPKDKPLSAEKIADMARRAIALRPATGSKVTLKLELTLERATAERLSARSIRESSSLSAVVAEIIEREEGMKRL